MQGKSSRTAATILAGLLYAQGFLCAASVTVVVLRDRLHSEPVFVMGTASLDAQRVN